MLNEKFMMRLNEAAQKREDTMQDSEKEEALQKIKDLEAMILFLRDYVDDSYFRVMAEATRQDDKDHSWDPDYEQDPDLYKFNYILSIWNENS